MILHRINMTTDNKLTLLPNCWELRQTGFHIGFKLLLITPVLQIGTEPPLSTTLDILIKGSYKQKRKMRNFRNGKQKKINVHLNREHVAEYRICTVLEKKSLLSK